MAIRFLFSSSERPTVSTAAPGPSRYGTHGILTALRSMPWTAFWNRVSVHRKRRFCGRSNDLTTCLKSVTMQVTEPQRNGQHCAVYSACLKYIKTPNSACGLLEEWKSNVLNHKNSFRKKFTACGRDGEILRSKKAGTEKPCPLIFLLIWFVFLKNPIQEE